MDTLIFDGNQLTIHDNQGEKWVTFRDLSTALGYSNPDDVRFIVDRNPDEFTGKQGTCILHTPGGKQECRVLNYRGVIRAAMKSDAPKAVQFRDWAEEVLFQVMTTGYYSSGIKQNLPHWTDELSPADFLKLTQLRVTIWLQIADRPRNRALWNALYCTYGGPKAYKRHMEAINGDLGDSNAWMDFDVEGPLSDDWEAEFGDKNDEGPDNNGPSN